MSNVIRAECEAWFRYADYCTRMADGGERTFRGDAASHELFLQWRKLRDERDAISQPHHKQNRMHQDRFSTRRAPQ